MQPILTPTTGAPATNDMISFFLCLIFWIALTSVFCWMMRRQSKANDARLLRESCKAQDKYDAYKKSLD